MYQSLQNSTGKFRAKASLMHLLHCATCTGSCCHYEKQQSKGPSAVLVPHNSPSPSNFCVLFAQPDIFITSLSCMVNYLMNCAVQSNRENLIKPSQTAQTIPQCFCRERGTLQAQLCCSADMLTPYLPVFLAEEHGCYYFDEGGWRDFHYLP